MNRSSVFKEHAVLKCMVNRDWAQLKELFSTTDVNDRMFKGPGLCNVSTLFYAAWKGHVAVVEFLARELKADVDARDDDDRTPLHVACAHGHDEVVASLLALGCSSNVADAYGFTPMSVAA